MADALATRHAMVGLAKLGHAAIISHEEVVTLLLVRLALSALRKVALLYHLVVMREDGRNVDAVGARHAVVALVARYCVQVVYVFGNVQEELVFLLAYRL